MGKKLNWSNPSYSPDPGTFVSSEIKSDPSYGTAIRKEVLKAAKQEQKRKKRAAKIAKNAVERRAQQIAIAERKKERERIKFIKLCLDKGLEKISVWSLRKNLPRWLWLEVFYTQDGVDAWFSYHARRLKNCELITQDKQKNK